MNIDQVSAGISLALGEGAAGSLAVKVKVSGVEYDISAITFIETDHQVAPEVANGPNYILISV